MSMASLLEPKPPPTSPFSGTIISPPLWTAPPTRLKQLSAFELTGLPFLVTLRPPTRVATTEEALPDGFLERVAGRGMAHDGWVPYQSLATDQWGVL